MISDQTRTSSMSTQVNSRAMYVIINCTQVKLISEVGGRSAAAQPGNRFVSFVRASGRGEAAWERECSDFPVWLGLRVETCGGGRRRRRRRGVARRGRGRAKTVAAYARQQSARRRIASTAQYTQLCRHSHPSGSARLQPASCLPAACRLSHGSVEGRPA